MLGSRLGLAAGALEGDEQLAVRALEAGVARRASGEERAPEVPVAMRALDLVRTVRGRGVGHLPSLAGPVRADS